MDQQWVAKSLTIWGVIIAILTAALPALAMVFPSLADKLTPDWLHGIDASVRGAITSVGVVVSSIMIVIDRISGETKKTLVLKNPK